MVLIFILTKVAVSMLVFPISLTENKIDVISDHMNIDGSVALSGFKLNDIKQEEFTVKIGFGYPSQILNLSLNLRGENTSVSGENCNCHKSENKYIKYKSYHSLMVNPVQQGYNFSSHHLKGFYLKDDILVGNQIINDSLFMMVTWDDLGFSSTADGFLGLGLYPEIEDESKSSKYNNHILNRLSILKLINEQKFSIYINNPLKLKKESMLTLGYWDPLEFAQASKKEIRGYCEDNAWTIESTAILINGFSYNSNSSLTFDLNSQSIKLSLNNYLNYFLPNIPKSANCTTYRLKNQEEYLMCNCDDDFPSLGFKLEYHSFYIYKESYLRVEQNGLCTLMIQLNSYDKKEDIMGIPFFKSYYTMFDMKYRKIIFQESINHEFNYNEDLLGVYQSGIALIVVVALSLGVFYVRKTEDIEGEIYQRVY